MIDLNMIAAVSDAYFLADVAVRNRVIYYNFSLEKAIVPILFLLVAVIVGAIYVSVINDVTDIKEDLKAGKRNSMAKVPILTRVAIVAVIVVIALFFIYMLYPDLKSMLYYMLA